MTAIDSRDERTAQGPLLLTMVTLAFMGQMILNPVIAPLSRAMGLQEWHVGATISCAAMALMLVSPFWGRRAQRVGVRRVLVVAMSIALCALVAFAAVAWVGTRGLVAGPALIIGMLLTRGVIYGGAIAAVTPTAQVHLVAHSATESDRVKAIGALGAMQGLASILGSVLGGVLAALGGLMFPVTVMPVVMLAGIVLLLARFRPQPIESLIPEPRRVSFADRRVLPFLVAGFALFLGLSAATSVLGFAVQDRFGIGDGGQVAGVTAALQFAMSMVMMLTQGGLVRRLDWGPRRLLRVGFLVALGGAVSVALHAGLGVMFAGCVLLGVGFGLAMPGYTAGPTNVVAEDEQGGVAGVINATNGLTFAIGPVLFTALYGVDADMPFLGIAALFGLGSMFVFAHPRLRGRGADATAEDATEESGGSASATERAMTGQTITGRGDDR